MDAPIVKLQASGATLGIFLTERGWAVHRQGYNGKWGLAPIGLFANQASALAWAETQ